MKTEVLSIAFILLLFLLSVIYWVNITPRFEQVIENKEFKKLVVKCKEESPDEAMIFLKKK